MLKEGRVMEPALKRKSSLIGKRVKSQEKAVTANNDINTGAII